MSPPNHILIILGPSPERLENAVKMEDESKEWMGVCYDENVIEYDEYEYEYQDDPNVEIDVEIQPENYVEFTVQSIDKSESDVSHTELHEYTLDEENVYTSTNTTDCVFNSVIEVVHDVEEVTQRELDEQKQQELQESLRTLRLKWFMHRENRRLKKKLTNCRICGTNVRFLNTQVSVLRAKKEKLLSETSLLQLTKEKLMNEVTSMQSNILVE